MKRLLIIILILICVITLAHSSGNYFFTVKGYVTNISDAIPLENLPVKIYPDITDTTQKYTVYTNHNGYYFLTLSVKESKELMISVNGFCDNLWIRYNDTVQTYEGIYEHNFNICHNPNWFMQEFVIQGFVSNSITSSPIPKQPIIITNDKYSNLSSTCLTDQNGFYSDTFVVNIFDSVFFSVSAYSFCNRKLFLNSHKIAEEYSKIKQVDFNICTEEADVWIVGFHHEVYEMSNEVYFRALSNTVLDSVHWDFGDGTFEKGIDALHQYKKGSYKVKMTAFQNGISEVFIDRIIVGESVVLRGNVYASGTLIDSGYVMAVSELNSTYSLIDVCKISNGEFIFEEILRGNYYLYAIPDFNVEELYFPKYIGSYPNGKCSWQESEIFCVEECSNTVDINLYKNNDIYYGENEIKFSVADELLYKYDVVNVVLYDSDFNPLNSVPLISEETKKFTNLPNGYYYIKAEIPACVSISYRFYLNSDFQPNINFFIQNDDEIGYRVGNNKVLETNIKVYPNPFVDFIQINAENSPLNVEIYNINSVLVHSQQIFGSEIISTNNFADGIYIFLFKNENEIVNRKILIKN